MSRGELEIIKVIWKHKLILFMFVSDPSDFNS